MGIAVLVAPGAADGVPQEVGVEEGGHLAHSDIEAVAQPVAEAEAQRSILTNLGIGERDSATPGLGSELGSGNVTVQKD